MYNLTKRTFDFFFSVFAILMLLPLMLLIFFISFFFHGKPVFFIHERLGVNGKKFKMIKFRSMKSGPSISAKNDELRLTNFGRFLRKTSIDEIPALFNVLKGEMSIVGPRPMPIKYLKRFNSHQIKRLLVKPGITGLAQIKGRNDLSWEEKFNLDVLYVRKKNLIMDLCIFFQTFFVVLKGKGVSSSEAEITPEFMGSKSDKN